MGRLTRAGLFFAGCFAVLGCGGEVYHHVTGQVLLDGKPLPGATVTLVSTDNRMFSTMSDTGGSFEIKAGKKKGPPAGSYKVIVAKAGTEVEAASGTPPDINSKDYLEMMKKSTEKKKKTDDEVTVPKAYGTVETTPLSANIPEDVPLKLDLKSKTK